jgi:hypothetical protein
MNYFSNLVSNVTTKKQNNETNLMPSNSNIYHEKQEKQLCALHSLNNLFQERIFSKANLDDICVE